MATKKPRYMISVDDDMFNAIEDFRFERRFQTRSEATTELIRLGLEQRTKEKRKKIGSIRLFFSVYLSYHSLSYVI